VNEVLSSFVIGCPRKNLLNFDRDHSLNSNFGSFSLKFLRRRDSFSSSDSVIDSKDDEESESSEESSNETALGRIESESDIM